ncbi:hypothetical protein PRIPAC_92660 [Pristionchus pacificus]|uniref:RNA binding protein n=1 Tax=Pristionchus pacificus TaxID=54126 RepID=A0A2A6BR63_PRIPA|nr:hypothetical protein PRIPAC_92660 [Pristionchus pacificus]|eukprot:PDM68400.1 RNA binding protein [Pristionchus pacificus]
MSNIDLSLDAIIAKTKKTNKIRGQPKPSKTVKRISGKIGAGVKKGAMGATKKENLFTKAVPTGKWKHDKFASLESTRIQPIPSTVLNSFVSANKKVRLNISNLAPTLTTADLKELFSSYPFDSAVVHYSENGVHLGTGEVTMKKNDVQKAIDDFRGIAVDGSRIRLAIVKGGAGGSIFDRVQIVKKVGGGAIKKRSIIARPQKIRVGKKTIGSSSKVRVGKRTNEGRLFSLDISNARKSSKGRGKGGNIPKKAMNEEELDAELNEYMKKSAN